LVQHYIQPSQMKYFDMHMSSNKHCDVLELSRKVKCGCNVQRIRTIINNLTASKRETTTLLDFCILQERGKLHIFYNETTKEEMLHWAIAPPLKPTKVTLFTTILYNSENSIRDVRRICRPLFCHSRFVNYTSSLLQKRTRNET